MRKILFIIPILILLTACKPIKEIIEVPVEVVKKEYIHDTKTDSIYIKDSIDRYIKGDTVFIYKERTKFRYINKTDTILKTDTVPKILVKTTVKEVKVNYIKWYQKLLMWMGGIMSLILTGYIIYKIKFK